MYKKIFISIVLYCSFLVTSNTVLAADKQEIRIASGPIISRYYLVASKLCYFIEQSNSNVKCGVAITNGTLENLELLRQNQVDLAIAQSDIAVEAFNGVEYFKSKEPFLALRQLLNLFPESFNVIAKDDDKIRVFADLNGKKISYGNKNSTTYLTYDELKELYPDFKPVEIELKPDDYARKLCKGEVDALIIMAGHPSPLINLIANTCNIEFVSIEGDKLHALLEHNRGFKRHILKKNIYSGISQDQHTMGVTAILLTNQSKNLDILRNLFNYFHKHIKDFQHTDELLKILPNNFFNANFVLPKHECIGG